MILPTLPIRQRIAVVVGGIKGPMTVHHLLEFRAHVPFTAHVHRKTLAFHR